MSFKHIVRAAVQNARAGRVVAGGSTLTQQTAKNLFYRPDRSLRSKAQELVDALRLEAHFSKEDILEFYANQFHVSANGRGLGIAARYFFDKRVDELTLKECAFIAGMVKAPSRYNP
ncbi:MAG: biosynthetic peptidoglycan transglycosylase, partial [bacterium]